MRPAAQRKVVEHVWQTFAISERRACAILAVDRTSKGAGIALAWPAALPWDSSVEAAQAAMLARAANQLVNSFRPRLERIGAAA